MRDRVDPTRGGRSPRPLDLRRTLGSWLAANGYSLPLIGKVLGHSQPAATAIYARLDVEPVRKRSRPTRA